MTTSEPILRRGTPDDTRAAFDLCVTAIADLFARQGAEWEVDLDTFFAKMKPYLDHLAVHAAEWWVAEDPSDGSLLGYARSVERGGLFELSELFVRPGRQSSGLGRRLIDLAYAPGRGEVRLIIATSDVRALARYYAAGTAVRFPIAEMTAPPNASSAGTLDARMLQAVRASLDDVPKLAEIETAVVGYPRDADYPWLIEHREGWLYRRDGLAVAFAFLSDGGTGPIAALEPADQEAILLHVEGRAHDLGVTSLSFDVPMVNEIAMRHLLGRGFKIDPPLVLLMSSVPFGKFDRFIAFAPGIVL